MQSRCLGCRAAVPRGKRRQRRSITSRTRSASTLKWLRNWPPERKVARSRSVEMPKLPGVNHLYAVRALEKAGFHVKRQGKHVVMTDEIRIVTVPRHNP